MTLIDVVVMSGIAYCGWAFIRNIGAVRQLGYLGSVVFMLLGLIAVAAFHLLDLLTMHLLPLVMSMERAMAFMRELHLNWSWGVTVTSVGVLVIGLARMVRNLMPQTLEVMQRLDQSRRELENALGNTKALEVELRASQESLEQRVDQRTEELSVIKRSLEEQIKERCSAEQALRRSRAEFKAIFDSISDAVVYTGPDGRWIQHTNPATTRLFGYTAAELEGRPLSLLWESGAHAGAERRKINAKMTRSKAAVELRYRRKDQTSFVGETTTNSIADSEDLIQGRVFVIRDTTQRRKSEDTIRRLAYHDSLTNLVNRNEFERRLSRAISAAREHTTRHALLYLDLDQFKVVNDTCGHAAGDALLTQVSALLKRPVRQCDTVARLGGDEFGPLLENCPAAQARAVAERIRELLVKCRFQWQGATFVAGASIGIVLIDRDSESMGEVLRKADLACFTAKELGRNRVHEYCDEDAELCKRHSEMQWVSRLNEAVDNGRFQLLRQVIVPLDAVENGPPRYELLVRMRGQNDEVIAPGAFIPAAERFNMIGPIDRWVIREAFRYLA